jgi:UDP-N-acetylglucosamine/UDP-N-acetylgalactosamine diphosphorylase
MSDPIRQKWGSRLRAYGQGHLLRFWDELSPDEREQLVADLEQIPLEPLSRLIDSHVRNKPAAELPHSIEPVPYYPLRPDIDLVGKYADAVKAGTSLIRRNKVAVLTVAGGQGSRLGFDGPKGAFPVSPVKNKTLFQLFAEFIRGARRRYGSQTRWYIMTSPLNDADTRAFFAAHDHFGLPADDVAFFVQGQMPALSPDGRILLDQKHRVALSPDGHGGILLALRKTGALQDMADRGIDHISYLQVDNPLVRVLDPLFVGLHELTGSEMSSKTIPKADDFERVGNFVVADGTTKVIEYSDLPDELATRKNARGERLFDAGSIGIHVLRRDFAERLTADPDAFGLPWHRAEKKVAFVDQAGDRHEPAKPNAVKLETFIFDALPLARNPLILQTSRAEEFSPVKNAEGADSAATSRRDMNRRAARWLEACGVDVPRTDDGEPDCTLEISPLLALDEEHLREVLPEVPPIERGGEVYLDRP